MIEAGKKKKKKKKMVRKPSYISHKILDNCLVAICKSKVTLTLNKPAYVGMCILDLIKVLMYKFHYEYIKNKGCNNSVLLFTDTDSLMYEINTEGVYEDFINPIPAKRGGTKITPPPLPKLFKVSPKQFELLA